MIISGSKSVKKRPKNTEKNHNLDLPPRRLKVAILELPLPLPLLQTAIMEISAILKA